MGGGLFARAVGKFLAGLLLTAVLLFVPAGGFGFWQAWLLIGVLFIPMFCAGLVLLRKNPALLERRLNMREERAEQKRAVALSGVMFLASFLLAGWNFRFRLLVLPDWVSYAAAGVFLLGYVLYAEVLRENEWLSRTVEVREGQQLVDTGLYGVVRHPMYLSTLLLFLAMPLVLGSLPSLAVSLLYVPIIAGRIRGEEALLTEELAGYADYQKRVRWRLVPHVW